MARNAPRFQFAPAPADVVPAVAAPAELSDDEGLEGEAEGPISNRITSDALDS